MASKETQGRTLIRALKRKPHSYLEMLLRGAGCSPWKRVMETLRADEALVKGRNKQGLVTWRVVVATKWTA